MKVAQLLLGAGVWAQQNAQGDSEHYSDCSTGHCFPATGDLLIGRESRLSATSTCGLEGEEGFCIVSNTNGQGPCKQCDTRRKWSPSDPTTHNAHNIENIIAFKSEDISPAYERRWWQSENGKDEVSIQVDFEAEFLFTHLIMTFKTFRPASMSVYRSSDNGASWKPYRHFAEDCASSFPDVEATPNQETIDQVVCDDSYGKKVPTTNGELVLKVLDPQLTESMDPYSPEIRDLLQVTNIRIDFHELHTLGDDHMDNSHDATNKYYYAVYNLVLRGSCFCNGHASQCVPKDDEIVNADVYGKCNCQHGTAGLNCEKCADFHHDQPWMPARANQTFECKRCECYGHATECHFDPAVYEATDRTSGGVCENCKHNTEGRMCERCIEGFYQDPLKNINDPEICVPCDCDPAGVVGACDRATIPGPDGTVAGRCRCKANVMGERCDQCKPGFHSLDPNNPDGCSPCDCDDRGSVTRGGSVCDPLNGQCHCKSNVTGGRCDTCAPHTYGLSSGDADGCKKCRCDIGGSLNQNCNTVDGKCTCRPNITGQRCNDVKEDHFLPNPFLDTMVTGPDGLNSDGVELIPIVLAPVAYYPPQPTSGFNEDPNEYYDGYPHYSRPISDSYSLSNHGSTYGYENINQYVPARPGTSVLFEVGDLPRSLPYSLHLKISPQAPDRIRREVQDTKGGNWSPVEVEIIRPPTDTRDIDSPCFNSKPEDDSWTATIPTDEPLVALGKDKYTCLETDADKGTVTPYKFKITLPKTNNYGNDEEDDNKIFWIERLQLVPKLDTENGYPGFKEEFNAEAPKLITAYEKCMLNTMDLPDVGVLEKDCDAMTYSISSWFHQGAKSCDCDQTGSISRSCDPSGGQCECREGVTGRTCNQCAAGFFGFSHTGCQVCDCNRRGTVNQSQFCEQQSGQCKCLDGVGGRQCDRCLPGFYDFPNCKKCECNGHANECDSVTGECLNCAHDTTGPNCEQCADGYYGDPTSVTNSQCSQCLCPDGPKSNRQFADTCSLSRMRGSSSREDEQRGPRPSVVMCNCNPGYQGLQCEQCAPGHFGNPMEPFGSCNPCECNGNIDTSDPDACDARTGECLKCLYNRGGADCSECADGYYEQPNADGTDFTCVPCGCDERGRDPFVGNTCDKKTGQCACLDKVEGRTCNSCRNNFFDLANAVDNGGCQACGCDPENSKDISGEQPCDMVTGQCRCKDGFGGRDCKSCEKGYYGDPKIGKCEACDCDPSGVHDPFACNAWTGQCECKPGIGGQHCDRCERGYHGIAPDCEPCGECFDSWDGIIGELIDETKAVLATVDNIRDNGVTGVYKAEFDQIAANLANARDTLSQNEEMNQLERFMADIESETNLGHSRLDDIKDSFGDINALDQRQKQQLAILKEEMDSRRLELAELTSALDEAEDKDPHVLWGRIKQAVADAAKYEILAKKAVGVFHNADDPKTNFLLASKNIRESVVQGMNQREEEFQQKSQELDILIDDVEPKIRELSIGEINQAVCGAYTEDCDEVCGGAQCLTSNGKQHCGNANYDVFNRGPRVNTCEESAYQISVSAKTHAENAQKRLEDIRGKVDEALNDTKEVREDALGAKEAAEKVRQKATDVEKNIREYTDRIINLVEEIEDFLSADEHTDPEDILKVAKQVLAIELPDSNKINELKEKMNSLSIRPSDSSSPDDNLSLTAVTSIAQKATKVLREAQELSDKVNRAADNFDLKESNCIEATEKNREANEVNDAAKIKIAETTTLIEDLKLKLAELAGLVDDQTIQQKRTQLNNKITESNSNIVMATEELNEADELFEEFRPRYEEFKDSGDRDLAIEFTDKVDELRHTQDSAKDLEANVDQLLEDVKMWHEKLKNLKKNYEDVKSEVNISTQNLDELKRRAESVRKNIYQKLYNPEQCGN